MDIEVEHLLLQIQQDFNQIAQEHSSLQHKAWKQRQHKNINSYWNKEEHVKGLLKIYTPQFKQLSLEQRFELAGELYCSRNEEQAAIALALLILNKEYITPANYSFLSSCVQCFNSWASVDAFCIQIIQDLLNKYQKQTLKLLSEWSLAKSPWKRRASIVAFTKAIGEEGKFIEEMLRISQVLVDDPEILVRKAVGWALKDHLYSNRKRIIDYTRELKRCNKSSVITNYVMRQLTENEKQSIREGVKPYGNEREDSRNSGSTD